LFAGARGGRPRAKGLVAAAGVGERRLPERDNLDPAERVVDEPGEGDGVAKHLQRRDVGAPDGDRDDDEEYVLEDARQGHDEARRLADLLLLLSRVLILGVR